MIQSLQAERGILESQVTDLEDTVQKMLAKAERAPPGSEPATESTLRARGALELVHERKVEALRAEVSKNAVEVAELRASRAEARGCTEALETAVGLC